MFSKKSKQSKVQKFFKVSSLFFLLVSMVSFYFYFDAQAANDEVYTLQDQMGNNYEFKHHYDSKQVYFNMTTYLGRFIKDGSFYQVAQDNFITDDGDNNIVAVYVDTMGKLNAKILAATWNRGGCAFKEIYLDRDIDSITANKVTIFRMHRFGAEVAWLDKNGVAKYAIFELWHCKIEEGDLADYPGGPPIDLGGPGTPISGKSVVLVLDLSGSMNREKISVAKDQLTKRVKGLNSDDEVALFTFSGCGNVPLIQAFTQNFDSVLQAISGIIEGTGSTPLAEAIDKARDYLIDNHRGQKGELTVFTDGMETCRGANAPVVAAGQVKATTFEIDFSLVGYNLTSEERKKMKEIAKAGGGKFKKKKVFILEEEQEGAKQAGKKAGAAGAAAAAAAASSYLASGGFNVSNMAGSVFGKSGLFVNTFKDAKNTVTSLGSRVSSGAAKAGAVAPKGGPSPPAGAQAPSKPPATPAKPAQPSPKEPKKTKLTKPKPKKAPPKFCIKCGRPLSPGNNFCMNCGAKI